MDGRLLEANVACICNGRQIQIGNRANEFGALGGGARDKIGPPLTLERAWRKRPDEHEASSFKAKGMGKKKLFTGLFTQVHVFCFPPLCWQAAVRSAGQLAIVRMPLNLLVHVKNKCIAISCGEGQQPVRWLANVGTARYDAGQGRSLGAPVGVRLEDGTPVDLSSSIAEAGLSDMQHVWIVHKQPGLSSATSSKSQPPKQPALVDDDD